MTIFTTAIAASADDAYESSGSMDLTSGLILVNTANRRGGWRFTNITIPPGSTINSATIEFYITSGSYDDPNVTIFCEDVDDAAAFTTTTNDISSRALTSASTPWIASDVGTGAHSTPSFASSVQEVIDRGGWASGNDLVVIITADSSSTLRVASWDSANPEAVITIDYTAPTGSGAPVKAVYYARLRGM